MNKEVLRTPEGEFIGFNLGADFAAEHEWGIEPMQRYLQISDNEKQVGIKRRTIKKIPNLFYIEGKKYIFLAMVDEDMHFNLQNKITAETLDKAALKNDTYPFSGFDGLYIDRIYNDAKTNKHLRNPKVDPEWEFSSAWDQRTFAIVADKQKLCNEMRSLRDAFASLDVAVWVGSNSNPFDRGGLIIVKTSAVPKDLLQVMKENDEDIIKLNKEAKKTGIVKKIDKINEKYHSLDAPCGYFALFPKWNTIKTIGRKTNSGNQTVTLKTDYKVIFFLNPRNQKQYSPGWYTVEELEQWIEGKGPVVSQKNLQQTHC